MEGGPVQESDTIVQYVVVRKDLKLGAGAMIAQGAHASTSAIWISRDTAFTSSYLAALDDMHKIVLEGTSTEHLATLSKSLSEASILHKLWVEKPENIQTALATAPYPRSLLKGFFAGCKLLR